MKKTFQDRVVAAGHVTAEALVSHGGLNTLASFQKALQFGTKRLPAVTRTTPTFTENRCWARRRACRVPSARLQAVLCCTAPVLWGATRRVCFFPNPSIRLPLPELFSPMCGWRAETCRLLTSWARNFLTMSRTV